MTENKILNIFLRWFGLVFIFFGVTEQEKKKKTRRNEADDAVQAATL